MGRSFAPIADAVNVERYDTQAHNPFEALGLTYLVKKKDRRVLHKETAGPGVQAEAEIAYAIGSGRRGRSYIVDHDGYLFESPITWYPLKGIWDLSPGYREDNPHFGRPIIAGCLFCHTNQVAPNAKTANRFEPSLFRGYAIGCERCHGPGELHVNRRRAGERVDGVDYSIVNPGRLEHSLREAVCQQCHLHSEARVLPRGREYFDFRPGLPLHLFMADFLRPANQRKANQFAGTVEQMYVSRCFEKSSGTGKLGCISCHDPHALPDADTRGGYYRGRCQTCHEEHPCSLPLKARLEKSPEDSCIVCHMPSLGASINHTAISDHSIPRKPKQVGAFAKSTDGPRLGQVSLELFQRNLSQAMDAQLSRDLGVALTDFALKHEDAETGRTLGERALSLVALAAAGDPRDVDAWEAKAKALFLLGRLPEALAACASSLKQNPDRETTLVLAASLAARLRQPVEMRAYAEKAFEINPWLAQCSRILASAYANEGEMQKAVEAGRKAVQLEPANLSDRQFLIRCYLKMGDLVQARAALESCLILLPAADRTAFRQWFEQQTAGAPKSGSRE
jgi:Flp pilus assembly protein TadD